MANLTNNEKILDRSQKIGKIKVILKAYQRWGISATRTLERIEEIINKEVGDERTST